MTSKIQYRSASRDEAKIIVDFQIKMARESENLELDLETVVKGVNRVFDEPRFGRYYLAIEAEQVIASTLVQDEWSDWRNGVVWWIHSVYVLPEYRRLGIFRGMYLFLKSEAAKIENVRGLRLYVEKHNHIAQRCYQNLGMSAERYDLYEEMLGGR